MQKYIIAHCRVELLGNWTTIACSPFLPPRIADRIEKSSSGFLIARVIENRRTRDRTCVAKTQPLRVHDTRYCIERRGSWKDSINLNGFIETPPQVKRDPIAHARKSVCPATRNQSVFNHCGYITRGGSDEVVAEKLE